MMVLLLLVLSSAAPAGEDHGGEQQTVRIVNMQFEPAELIVKRGTRIVWTNEDLFPHTVTAGDRTFDSGAIATSSSWTYVAAQPGTHIYVCTLHPTMQGRVIVQ